MGKKFYFVLSVILLVIFVACFVIQQYWEAKGFFINLMTEVIGIIITVFCVDMIIKHKEKVEWSKVERKINDYILIIINSTITSIRHAFNCDDEFIKIAPKMINYTPTMMTKELLLFSERILEKNCLIKIKLMKENDWNTMVDSFRNIYDKNQKIVMIYGDKLSSELYGLILDIQNSFDAFFSIYATWPDVLKDEIKIEDELRDGIYDITVKRIMMILNSLKAIYEKVK